MALAMVCAPGSVLQADGGVPVKVCGVVGFDRGVIF